MRGFHPRRFLALSRKEAYQIVRDPSSILVAFILPIILLFVIGYAINLDNHRVRIGLLIQDTGREAQSLKQALMASHVFDVHRGASREALQSRLDRGELRGLVLVDPVFTAKGKAPGAMPIVQVLTDGSEPNTATFISAYVKGALSVWQQGMAREAGLRVSPLVDVNVRTLYNPNNISHHFIVPGTIAVVMTIVGALLTSLVVAREWERGTMEALLATPVTQAEWLASKFFPYYVLGMAAIVLCLGVAVLLMGVPFRGHVGALLGISSLFLGSALGNGLFLSTVMRSQFNAASAALLSAFLPAQLLSGVVFEISSMPKALQLLSHCIPATYFVNALQSLFLVGTLLPLLLTNAVGLCLLMVFWLGLTIRNTRRTLD